MQTAAYARYSSDAQREASIEDQLRNIRNYCVKQGWPAPVVFQDAAISGSREDRPGYQALMAAATSGRFDVVLLDDLSRLTRDTGELHQVIKRLRFCNVRLLGVSDGVDTSRKGHKVEVGLRGLMSELYLEDLADKTHRGLTGRALAGASAGGLPFGYRVTTTGQRAVDEAQAAVVRRIFGEFAEGRTPREIAAGLNADGMATARGGTWGMTSIYGDVRRGIGILANPIYVGRQIWNRSKWIKHPDSGRRRRLEHPESEWIITEHPELAIVSEAVWDAAQERIRRTRSRTAAGRARGKRAGGGSQNRYLLSGLLRCEQCGGPLVIVDYYRYGCSSAKDRGQAVCSSKVKVPRADAELALLQALKHDLLSEDRFRLYEREMRAALKDATPDLAGARQRVQAAEGVLANLMAALRAGIITPGTKAALVAAEADVATAQRDLRGLQDWQPAQMVPRARELWRSLVASLENTACVSEAREAVRATLGDQIVITQKAGALYARVPASCELTVVAGAGFVRWLTSELTIPIPKPTPDRRQV